MALRAVTKSPDIGELQQRLAQANSHAKEWWWFLLEVLGDVLLETLLVVYQAQGNDISRSTAVDQVEDLMQQTLQVVAYVSVPTASAVC